MARNSRKTASKRTSGGTMYGLLVGLTLGVAAAAAVAYLVTQVPMPFADKASRDPAQTLLPAVRDAPDPNIGLYGKNAPAGTVPTGPTATPPIGLPGSPPASQPTSPSMSDDIGALLATLGSPADKPAAVPGTQKPEPQANSSGAAATPAPPPQAADASTTYYLQAGAFRSESDAEGVKAQILLMGLPVRVEKGQSNGSVIHRVRVGPFKGLDPMNRARMRLGEAKIESSVVKAESRP